MLPPKNAKNKDRDEIKNTTKSSEIVNVEINMLKIKSKIKIEPTITRRSNIRSVITGTFML